MRPIRFKYLLLLVCLMSAGSKGVACVDSIRTKIDSVKCYGLRDGKVSINKVFGGQGPYYFSMDGTSFSTNPVFKNLWAGNYTIYVRDAGGCVHYFQITVAEPPELKVHIQASDTLIVAGKPLELQAFYVPQTAIIQTITWRPPALFPRQDTLEQTVSISQATDFAIELADRSGCTASSQVRVDVEKTQVYFPNIINPASADDARFTAFAGEGVARIKSLKIYSRSGSVVFEQHDFLPNDPLKGWNGRWNGHLVQSGVYMWLAEIELLDGTVQRHEGAVTVVE